GDIVYCTMELIEGESLHARLARARRLPVAEAVAVVRELCAALTAAHAAGVIHRDIKPDNVMIARDGRIVLADFGVAAVTMTELGERSGTLAYMPPEQARGEPPTPASDVYSVGVLLYEMISGERAFRGPTVDVIRAKQERPYLEISTHGPDIARIVARATARDPAARIATAGELDHALAALDHVAPGAPPADATHDVEERTVIVLPPRATDASRHLALAVHEALLARLARLPRVRALSRAAVSDASVTVVELVASEDLVASITTPGGVPIRMQLPLSVRELDSVAAAIASAVANSIVQPAAPLADDEVIAMELLLRARAHLQRGFGEIGEALELLDHANHLSPGNARITSALAICEVRAAFFLGDLSPARLIRARGHVRVALATAPDRADSHVAAGHLMLHVGRPTRAAQHFREAIALAPQLAEAHEHLGRMLLEAGFEEAGLARIGHALAISPELGTARWDVARSFALAGRWDDCDRLVAELVASRADRWLVRLRFAWWRRDKAALARIVGEAGHTLSGIALAAFEITKAMLDDAWRERREALLEATLAPTANMRRRAFNAQLAAEAAGYFGDLETCVSMIDRAANAGAFDRPWLERCPLLDAARGVGVARVLVARRADSILDALYGDYDGAEEPETAVL
ncbi:MAG TPA: protein kinase, partial [Kofleriaceae bacterium]|nr:protein kinase [Kofleriaceae bacterium]